VYIIHEEDYKDFCRQQYDKISMVLALLGIANDETFEDFMLRNQDQLEVEYLTSIGKLSIH
jgi:ribosome assembly protein YihI (activator of Der GTPase)